MSEESPSTPTEPAASEWLTSAGLSQLLGGIPISTVRGWRLAGIGPPYVKLGGLVRYRRAEVEKWIARGGDRRRGGDGEC